MNQPMKTHIKNLILIPTLIAGLCLLSAGRVRAQAVTHIAAGGYHSLFVRGDGSLWGMGTNGYGQLGLGQALKNTNVPQQITSGVSAVAAGYGHSLFFSGSGVSAMGLNNFGQLGDGTRNNHYVPERIFSVNLSVRLTALSAGAYHSLFGSYTLLGGSLWAMGYN